MCFFNIVFNILLLSSRKFVNSSCTTSCTRMLIESLHLCALWVIFFSFRGPIFSEGGDSAGQGADNELWQTQAVTSPLSPTRKELNFDPKATAAYPNHSTAKKAKDEKEAAEEAAQKAAQEKEESEAQAKKAALEAEETAAAMRVLAASSSPGSLADRQAALDAAAERQAERRAAEQEKLDAALSSEEARTAAREREAAEKREADKASRQAARAKERAAEAKGASDRLQRAKAEVMAKVRFGANLAAAAAASSSSAAAHQEEADCTVAFDVSLFDQSVERFGMDERLKFKKATAAALSVPARCVLLDSVRAGSCVVVTRVEELPNADAARAVAAIVRDKETGLVAALADSGLGRCSVSAPVVTVPEPVNASAPAEVDTTQDTAPAASSSNSSSAGDVRPPSPRGRSSSPKARAVSPSQAAKRPPSPVRHGWGELAAKGVGNNTAAATPAPADAGANLSAEDQPPSGVASPPSRGGGRAFEPGAGLPPPKAPPVAVATESTSPWVTQSGLPSPTRKSNKASAGGKRGTSFEEDQPYEVSQRLL